MPDDDSVSGRLALIRAKTYPAQVEMASLIELLESATARFTNDLLPHIVDAWNTVKESNIEV
jgi:hypothetical protein